MPRLLDGHLAAERHRGSRAAWLRAAVLGANDGLISTASLIVGVAASDTTRSAILVAGIAGLTAGALSRAAGEYVSVSSQLDTERADIAREQQELTAEPEAELEELTGIYERRGLSPGLAREVASQLSNQDRLAVHVRDELGIEVTALARPVQAAAVSALSFISGALLPVLIVAHLRRRPPPACSSRSSPLCSASCCSVGSAPSSAARRADGPLLASSSAAY